MPVADEMPRSTSSVSFSAVVLVGFSVVVVASAVPYAAVDARDVAVQTADRTVQRLASEAMTHAAALLPYSQPSVHLTIPSGSYLGLHYPH